MPPKKKEVEEKQVLIGRMGTNLKCGIVGKYRFADPDPDSNS
jgi:hypothetical protein